MGEQGKVGICGGSTNSKKAFGKAIWKLTTVDAS